jgi:hypothetical protein
LAAAHSLVTAAPVVDLASDDEDVKPMVKNGSGSGADATAATSAISSFYNILSLNFCKNQLNLTKSNEIDSFYEFS